MINFALSAFVTLLLVIDPVGLVPAFLAECELATGADPRLDAHLAHVRENTKAVLSREDPQFEARRIVEDLALSLQGALLVRHAPAAVADAFGASRLGRDGGHAYGTLPAGVDAQTIIERALPV